MANKLKYHLDHPQIKRNKSPGNGSSPFLGQKKGMGASMPVPDAGSASKNSDSMKAKKKKE